MAAYRRSMRALGQAAREAANLAESTGERHLHLVDALPEGESVRSVVSTVRDGTTIYDGSMLFDRGDEFETGFHGSGVFDQDSLFDEDLVLDGSSALEDLVDCVDDDDRIDDDETNVLSLAAARARRAGHPAGADRD